VVEKVRKAQQAARVLRHQGMYGLVCVEKSRPRDQTDFRGQRGGSRASVEGVVAVPEPLPGVKVPAAYRAYYKFLAIDRLISLMRASLRL
jgi:hypothetical protein